MRKVVTVGEILVEIMAQERGVGFRETLHLLGPYPSGAPAIFIDQVAKLGQPCGIVSCVGDDDFGRLNIERLKRDGVDVRAVEVLTGQMTASAFVRYEEDGTRCFLYNIGHSAFAQLRWTDSVSDLLAECGHLHVSGASLSFPRALEVVQKAVPLVKANGGSVSFDPNIRRELTADSSVRDALVAVLSSCDLFLPSGDELTLLTRADTPQGAISEILGMGVSVIVIKQGSDGATYHDTDGSRQAPGYVVEELDPTGAGDCFDATFVTCQLQGRGVEESLTYANACGARAVGISGPMEGTSSFAELDAFMAEAQVSGRSS